MDFSEIQSQVTNKTRYKTHRKRPILHFRSKKVKHTTPTKNNAKNPH